MIEIITKCGKLYLHLYIYIYNIAFIIRFIQIKTGNIMRNIIILLTLLFSLSFVKDANAQSNCVCGGFYSPKSITRTISDGVNSCQITINYCVLYDKYRGHMYISLCDISIPFGCNLNLDLSNSSFWDKILDEAIIEQWVAEHIPDCGPNGEGEITYEVTRKKCWILKNDPVQQMYVFEPCEGDAGNCFVEYLVCYNNGVLQKTEISSSTSFGQSSCEYMPGMILDPITFPFYECFDTCY